SARQYCTLNSAVAHLVLPSFPTRRSSDLGWLRRKDGLPRNGGLRRKDGLRRNGWLRNRWHAFGVYLPGFSVFRNFVKDDFLPSRSEEHTSELQSRENLVCRLLLEKKK